jgi:hypothetical protein
MAMTQGLVGSDKKAHWVSIRLQLLLLLADHKSYVM